MEKHRLQTDLLADGVTVRQQVTLPLHLVLQQLALILQLGNLVHAHYHGVDLCS
jgi:hypothetical protein